MACHTQLKVTQLKDLCRSRDISMTGTKGEIIDRLRAFAEGKIPTKTDPKDCSQNLSDALRGTKNLVHTEDHRGHAY